MCFYPHSSFSSLAKRYEDFLQNCGGHDDDAQRFTLARLEALKEKLVNHDWAKVRRNDLFWIEKIPRVARSALESVRAPQGIYVAGSVGTGKTMLMDFFIDSLVEDAGMLGKRISKVANELDRDRSPKEGSWTLRRTHFHRFMLDIHGRLHRLKQESPDENDPLLRVAADIARETPLLCFDEWQVTDVADALILHRLFNALFAHGAVVVATSNRRPSELYEGGINRFLFLPFIDLLSERCDVVNMAQIGAGRDYRLLHTCDGHPHTPGRTGDASGDISGEASLRAPRFLWPFESAEKAAEFDRLCEEHALQDFAGTRTDVEKIKGGVEVSFAPDAIPVAHGRMLRVPLASRRRQVPEHPPPPLSARSGQGKYLEAESERGRVARFTFDELFRQPLGASDYLALSGHYHTLCLANVPQLNSAVHNEVRRFITFLDIWYESGCLLVCSSAGPLDELFVAQRVSVGADQRVDRDAMVDGVKLPVVGSRGQRTGAASAGGRVPSDDGDWSALSSSSVEISSPTGSPSRATPPSPPSTSEATVATVMVPGAEVAIAGTAVRLGSTPRTGGESFAPTPVESAEGSVTAQSFLETAFSQGLTRPSGDLGGEEDSSAGEPAEISVVDSGGSSGRATTMIGSAEWSATGRLGVSLAEFSAVKDVAFAFQRALSRLVEMQSLQYAEKHRRKFAKRTKIQNRASRLAE